MFIATFKSDAWQVAHDGWQPATPGGDPLPVVTVSQVGEPIPIAVPESLLDEQVLKRLLGSMLVDGWKQVRRHFRSVSDELSERFAMCLPEWLNYAGGGLYAFGNDTESAVRGRIYVGLYPWEDESDENGYGLSLCFVIDGVAASEGPFCEAHPHNALHAMYHYWLQIWDSMESR